MLEKVPFFATADQKSLSNYFISSDEGNCEL